MVAPVRAAKRRRSAEERVRSVVNLLVGAALALLEHRARRVSPKSDSICLVIRDSVPALPLEKEKGLQ